MRSTSLRGRCSPSPDPSQCLGKTTCRGPSSNMCFVARNGDYTHTGGDEQSKCRWSSYVLQSVKRRHLVHAYPSHLLLASPRSVTGLSTWDCRNCNRKITMSSGFRRFRADLRMSLETRTMSVAEGAPHAVKLAARPASQPHHHH